ncbi:NAD-dependent epimerase/dehydratase family protein [Frankia sp. AgKG'84/4]|uniref:NAD-dependent epimerase/dehydratase family protein n=1 Tax=Frankia sp. AgKG'84/4 TaxID=573490 RepID=UPI00200BD3AB|nr:NAD-dependent epimerase/dehydratase family protein [Frankia sp. AgKG'84/4]MCL9792769.1 NAD-dependent epimerase/dehydratase family protein [Frankia sp. AgKG'84/4]
MYVIVGAGATGSAAARLLADTGERVRLVTRRGSGPVHGRIERIAADATDAARLAELATGAKALFNCAAPPYDRWPAEFPPLAAAMLAGAERAGTDYVMLSNIYCYGMSDGPLTEDYAISPSSVKGQVRAQMWADALAAHDAGRVRVTEVRASDFLGAGVASLFCLLVAPAVLAGQPGAYPGDLDAPHAWSYVGDVARTLVAAARHEQSWGRAWHVPSTSQLSVRELAGRLAATAGESKPVLAALSATDLERLGRDDSVVAEVLEMLYLFDRPTLLDASATRAALDIDATSLDAVLKEMAVPPAASGS